MNDFIKFLYLVKKVLATKELKDYVEYKVNTRRRFSAFLYNSKGVYGNNWTYGLGFDRFYTGATVFFKAKDIEKLIEAMVNAKDRLINR